MTTTRATPVAASTAKVPSKAVRSGPVTPTTATAIAPHSAAAATPRVHHCRRRGRNEPLISTTSPPPNTSISGSINSWCIPVSASTGYRPTSPASA
ncbi:hypothetical protein [Mycobacterium parascrofulaceum]|uniref:hypothetical protein n=1 Tax=Mycobacterium parascrofulaceum TaxID=240125 RepID=UPI001FCAC776|nr:hypothetical protein [Mycobacterium parascrofulaceum]